MTVTIKTTIRDMPKVIMADPERLDLMVDAAFKIDKELKSGAGKLADDTSDDFVNWNFKRTWRSRNTVKKNALFGTDYDYYNAVANQALALWRSMTGGSVDPDTFGRRRWESPERAFSSSLGIWENKKRVTFNTPLKGPNVDIGPTVDYGLFLEAWDGSKYVRGTGPYINILHRIGVLHALAEQLQADWQGAHRIFAATVDPDELDDVSERPLRRNPIQRFPIVRIRPRHHK